MKGVQPKFKPSRPGGDTGRWYLFLANPPPGAKSLIPVVDAHTRLPLFTHRSDREKVERWADATIAPILGPVLAVKLETCDEWMERFVLSRTGKVSTASRDHQQWLKWISKTRVRGGSTTLGKLGIVSVTPDDIEAVRDVLNAEIEKWEAASKKRGVGLSYATAANVWAILTQAMKHASTRKGEKSLRVREAAGNPCTDIPPPKSGEGKRRHWLRPNELAKMLECESPEVPLEWKETIAIGLFLHLRPNELHVLRVRDVDLDVREVSITRAWDAENECVKEPKTSTGVRTVTIPETLVPLLERMVEGAEDDVLLCPIVSATSDHDRPEIFRKILKAAGVTRAELFVDSATHEQIDFRTIRDSGITFRFLAGQRAEVVQREAGHRTLEQTLAYAKEVQDRGGRYGVPFAPLPACLVPQSETKEAADTAVPPPLNDRNEVPEPIRNQLANLANLFSNMVARVGFEPTTFGL